MDEEIKAEWEQDITDRCPYCGNNDFDWIDSDDGDGHIEYDENWKSFWVEDGYHWYESYCYCDECGKEWTLRYEMVNPRVYGEEK